MNKAELVHELGINFIDYAAAVNTDRAIPDAYCGLKPVARRILFGAYANGRTSNKPYVKCARIAGDVMGQLHPHGDSSIYDAMVRLSQDWVMRYPLIDFHGNMGNIMGDGAAAMRYTEARLSKLAEQGMLCGINKNSVDFIPNYDETIKEPVTLPSIFPNLLCNPNNGIGVAMACNWPANNLREVAQAINDYLDGKEPTISGPDFPTGGIVLDKDKIPQILKTGKGSIRIRGRYKIEKNKIVFYEIPYGTTLENLIDQIGACADNEEIKGITDVHDESNKKGLRLVIETEKGNNIDYIVNCLFQKTDLQSNFAYNQVALVDKVPTELNFKDCIKIYVDHNLDCICREAKFDLDKAEARKEIVEGLLKALEDIDNIIALIKKSSTSSEAKDNLITKYGFTDPQAKAIVAMRLGSLANLEKIEIENEHKELAAKIADLQDFLAKTDRQIQTLRERLADIVKKFGDDRRTEIIQLNDNKKEDAEIASIVPDKVVVTLTKSGMIKRTSVASFKTKRKKTAKSDDDIVIDTIRTNTVDSLMIFTNKGMMYRLIVNGIPEGDKPISVHSLVKMASDEYPEVIYSIYKDTDAKYVLFITKNGLVKKTALDEFVKTRRKTGIAAINLREGDSLASVSLIKEEPLILVTKNGMVIKFASTEIAATGRATAGVKGIDLKKDDYVVTGLPLRDSNDNLALFTSEGYSKQMEQSELVTQKRAGMGVVGYKATESSGYIIGAALITAGDNLLLVKNVKSVCVKSEDIPILKRNSTGNLLAKGGIQSVSKI